MDRKKILIDATPVTSLVDGLSVYIINLIKHLPKESFREFEFTILIQKGLIRQEFTSYLKTAKYNILEKKIAAIGPKRDFQMFLFLLRHKKKFDLIHITSNNYPFSLGKGVCTIHDITFKRYFDHPRYSFNLATIYMNAVIKHSLKKSIAVIAVSNSTKNELIKWYKLKSSEQNKIKVVYEGWEHLKDYKEQDTCTDNFVLNNEYIFYLGSFRIHKNLSTLIKAFGVAINTIPLNKKLAISGGSKHLSDKDKELLSEINKNGERLVFTGYLSNSCVKKYYKNADAFILPSLSEGFGIPILEAFYFGTPVLCSNTTSLPEVAGNSAIYFDPHNVESISKAIINFYNNPGQREILMKEGYNQLRKFSWSATSLQTINIYRECVNNL